MGMGSTPEAQLFHMLITVEKGGRSLSPSREHLLLRPLGWEPLQADSANTR